MRSHQTVKEKLLKDWLSVTRNIVIPAPVALSPNEEIILANASVYDWWRIEDDESNIERGSGGNSNKMKSINSLINPSNIWAVTNETEGAVIDETAAHKVWTIATGTKMYLTFSTIAQPFTFIVIAKINNATSFSGFMAVDPYNTQDLALVQHRLATASMKTGIEFDFDTDALVDVGGVSFGYAVHQFTFNGASSNYTADDETTSPRNQTGDAGTDSIANAEYLLHYVCAWQMLDFIIVDEVIDSSLLQTIKDYATERYGDYSTYPV